MFSPSLLIQTKLMIPQVRPDRVSRSRLIERINQGIGLPLTLISAPAGYGKTSLLADWARQSHLPVAWITLTPDDNDPQRFLAYLIESLQKISPAIYENASQILADAKRNQLDTLMIPLINELSQQKLEFVMVLDEYQTIEQEKIHRGINFLLENMPPQMHLVLSTRVDPPLSLSRMRAHHRLLEIRTQDLRFTHAEILEFLQNSNLSGLPSPQIEKIEQTTEGWITGLQLAVLTLQSSPDHAFPVDFSGNFHFVVDFLVEEVLSGQPEEIRRFLLRTSILDALHESLCQDVAVPEAPPETARRLLDQLDQANLFLTALDKDRHWFRYHTLFSDCLRHLLEEEAPEEIPALHERASIWYESHGDVVNAIQHALDGGQMAQAAELLEKNNVQFLKLGLVDQLSNWLNRFSPEFLQNWVSLLLMAAWCQLLKFNLTQVEQLLASAQEHLSAYDPDHARVFSGDIAAMHSLIHIFNGNLAQALADSYEALEKLPKDNLFLRSYASLDLAIYQVINGNIPEAIIALEDTIKISRQGNNLLVEMIALCQLGNSYAIQGKLAKALNIFEHALEIAHDPNGEPLQLIGLPYLGIGNVHWERNQPETAQKYLQDGIQLLSSWLPTSTLDGYIALALIQFSQGDREAAWKSMDQAKKLAQVTDANQWDDLIVSAYAACLFIREENLPEALRSLLSHSSILPNGRLEHPDAPYMVIELLDITFIRLRIAEAVQDRERTLQLSVPFRILQERMEDARKHDRGETLLELLILQAEIYQLTGEPDLAVNSIFDALRLAQDEGYLRVFCDEGEILLPLLREARDRATPADQISLMFLRQVIQLISGEAAANGELVPATRVENLNGGEITRREEEILILIAEGYSNQEIANELFLSLNTVKRHVYHIFNKLDAQSRVQAVNIARQRGLLNPP